MVTMSQKEFQRVKVIENAADGRLSVREASRLLQLSQRQVQRLKRRYRPDSVAWVQHGNRGRCMPWAVSIPQKQLILSVARGKYQGFNDSHLAEKLQAEENLAISRFGAPGSRPDFGRQPGITDTHDRHHIRA
jgi:transposase